MNHRRSLNCVWEPWFFRGIWLHIIAYHSLPFLQARMVTFISGPQPVSHSAVQKVQLWCPFEMVNQLTTKIRVSEPIQPEAHFLLWSWDWALIGDAMHKQFCFEFCRNSILTLVAPFHGLMIAPLHLKSCPLLLGESAFASTTVPACRAGWVLLF